MVTLVYKEPETMNAYNIYRGKEYLGTVDAVSDPDRLRKALEYVLYWKKEQ